MSSLSNVAESDLKFIKPIKMSISALNVEIIMQLSITICFVLLYIYCMTNKYVVSFDSENIIEMSTTDRIMDSQIQLDESDEMYYSDEKDEEKLYMKDIQQLVNITNIDEIRRKAAIYRTILKSTRINDVAKLTNLKSRESVLESEISEMQLLIFLDQMLKQYCEYFNLYEWTEMNPPFVANKTLITLQSSLDDKKKEYERQRWLFFLKNPPNQKIEKLKEFMDGSHNDVICIDDFSNVVSELHSRILKFKKAVSQCNEALPQPLKIFMFDDSKENVVVLLLMQGVFVPEKIKILVRKELQSKPHLMLMSYNIFKI